MESVVTAYAHLRILDLLRAFQDTADVNLRSKVKRASENLWGNLTLYVG